MKYLLVETVFVSIEFSGFNENININPEGLNLTEVRNKLYNMTSYFDDVLADAYENHESLPSSFICRKWVDGSIESPMLSPKLEIVNTSYVDLVRLL